MSMINTVIRVGSSDVDEKPAKPATGKKGTKK